MNFLFSPLTNSRSALIFLLAKRICRLRKMDTFLTRQKRKFDTENENESSQTEIVKMSRKERDCHSDSTKRKSMDDKQCPLLRKLKADGLDCDYYRLYTKTEADEIFRQCEEQLVFNTGKESQVQVLGKWHEIRRKQVAHGEEGLTYTFSGKTVPAKPWIPLLTDVRDKITSLTGHDFNFVLINRYKNGNDSIGEHRDDEKDLVADSPIASLSLGQKRDFVFKHARARGKNATRKDIKPITIELEHGCLLMMNYPTNKHWYHSLPKRKNAPAVRINMTFRKMVTRIKP